MRSDVRHVLRVRGTDDPDEIAAAVTAVLAAGAALSAARSAGSALTPYETWRRTRLAALRGRPGGR